MFREFVLNRRAACELDVPTNLDHHHGLEHPWKTREYHSNTTGYLAGISEAGKPSKMRAFLNSWIHMCETGGGSLGGHITQKHNGHHSKHTGHAMR